MGSSIGTWIHCAALALVVFGTTARAGLWHVDIDNYPAPPPSEGPPFSAHAIRNPGVLPYEIIGIVSGYIGTIFILGIFVLTVGRRSRKRAQKMAMQGPLPNELVKSAGKLYDPSPITPKSERSWYGRRLSKRKSLRSVASEVWSPQATSISTFDPGVVETDKQRRAVEMERLYAVVLADDDRKSKANSSVSIAAPSPMQPDHFAHQVPQSPMGAPPEYSKFSRNQAPSTTSLPHDTPRLRHLRSEESFNARSPQVRAIFPPESPAMSPWYGPITPARLEGPASPRTPTQFPQSPHFHPNVRQSRTSSIGSVTSPGYARQGIYSPTSSLHPTEALHEHDGLARTPRTPRYPSVPAEPLAERAHDGDYAPTTPGTARSVRFAEQWGQEEIAEEEEEEVYAAPLSNPPPQRVPMGPGPATPKLAVPRKLPKNAAAMGGGSDLPFRRAQQEWQSQSQSQSSNAAYVPYSGVPLSAGPTKTTFVETRRGGPSALKTPITGAATPYSPYMPFTPLTPVTPRLTSRAERRQRQKDERRELGALTEEDQVKDDRDLWGDGY